MFDTTALECGCACGWDLMDKCNLLSRVNAEGYKRPTQLDMRIHINVHQVIAMRRAKRRNGAAYQHRRRRSLTGGHAVIAHGRRMEYQRSRSMVRKHSIARRITKSWSDRASLPRKRAQSAHGNGY